MKILIAIGAAGLAAIPFLKDGCELLGTSESSDSTVASCCSLEATGEASLASLTVPAVAYDADSTGSIKVTTVFDGDVPEPLPPLTLDAAKTEGCDAHHAIDTTDRTRIVSKDGKVANVVVTVEIKGVDPVVPDKPYVLDQSGCRYEPHVLVIPVGASIRYKNSDTINHNVHTFSKKNASMNNNVAAGSAEEQTFEKREEFKVSCDIHPWMGSWVVVTEDARFGTTAVDGTYKLEGLPPGEYKVSYWHESLGKGTSDAVTVAAGATAELELKIGEDKKKGGRGRR
jgi:plastocyanin